MRSMEWVSSMEWGSEFLGKRVTPFPPHAHPPVVSPPPPPPHPSLVYGTVYSRVNVCVYFPIESFAKHSLMLA